MYPWVLIQRTPQKVATSVEDLSSRLDASAVDQVECEEVAGALVVEVDSLGEGFGEVSQGLLSSRCHLTTIECLGDDESDDELENYGVMMKPERRLRVMDCQFQLIHAVKYEI